MSHRHLIARMHTAGEDLPRWRDDSFSHNDWRQYQSAQGHEGSVVMVWRPPYANGESHVSYTATNWPGKWSGGWQLRHDGYYRGPYHHEDQVGRTYNGPTYHREDDGAPLGARGDLDAAGTATRVIGSFPSLEDVQAAAQAHFDKNYGDRRPSFDHEERPAVDLDNFDYGDIFGEGR